MPNDNYKMLINPRNREDIREDVGVREERRVERGRLYFSFYFVIGLEELRRFGLVVFTLHSRF